MEDAWAELKSSISLANRLNKTDEELAEFHSQLKTALRSAVTRCRTERKRKLAQAPQLDLSDESVLRAARFTDHLPLADYAQILHLCPRLVNVVTASICTQTLLTPYTHTRAHTRARAGKPPFHYLACCAVGRGGAHTRQRRHAATRPALHRRAVHERVLCAAQIRRGPARLQQPAVPRADLP